MDCHKRQLDLHKDTKFNFWQTTAVAFWINPRSIKEIAICKATFLPLKKMRLVCKEIKFWNLFSTLHLQRPWDTSTCKQWALLCSFMNLVNTYLIKNAWHWMGDTSKNFCSTKIDFYWNSGQKVWFFVWLLPWCWAIYWLCPLFTLHSLLAEMWRVVFCVLLVVKLMQTKVTWLLQWNLIL